jgi:hypothetical protein
MALAANLCQPQDHGTEFDGDGGRTMGTTGDSAERIFTIVSRWDGKLMNLCSGPSPDGRCSRADRGELPCAGARVVPLRGTAADGLPFSIAVGQQGPVCPLSWLDQESVF